MVGWSFVQGGKEGFPSWWWGGGENDVVGSDVQVV